MGMAFAQIGALALVDHIFFELAAGRGGWLVTANLDFLQRFMHDSAVRSLYSAADIRVADGMPLIWASQLKGKPLPARIAGSTLTWAIAQRAEQTGRTLYLLGGDPETAVGASDALRARWPAIRVCGCSDPRVSSPPTSAELAAIEAKLAEAAPDILFVGLGSPKQEQVIAALRTTLPRTWMVGVGISFSFMAGTVARAPNWLQASGLEWVYRLVQEPHRLARRYLLENVPFAFRLFPHALACRLRDLVQAFRRGG
jgi:N-acetylglucosaminyldiphosphoundecaprenol N-acetyl-beta-D-mannosaminyltransferase